MVLNCKNSLKFVSRWIDAWDCQALTANLHLIVKVLPLGESEGSEVRVRGDVEGCSRFVRPGSFF